METKTSEIEILLKSKLTESIEEGFNYFRRMKDLGNFQYFPIELKTEWLQEPPLLPSKQSKYPLNQKIMDTFFTEFDKHNEPNKKLNEKTCLYIFEYPKSEVEYIIKEFQSFKKDSSRNSSAIKDTPYKDDIFLYVGKVKKDLGKRLSTHFGFAHEKTGGLQLRHWLKKDMKLIVHIFAFDDPIENYVNPLELFLSTTLNPLIGKSK